MIEAGFMMEFLQLLASFIIHRGNVSVQTSITLKQVYVNFNLMWNCVGTPGIKSTAAPINHYEVLTQLKTRPIPVLMGFGDSFLFFIVKALLG